MVGLGLFLMILKVFSDIKVDFFNLGYRKKVLFGFIVD